MATAPSRHEPPVADDHNLIQVIDLGPGAGHDGGRVVFTGTPARLVADADTLTARHLREYVGFGVGER
ncbi:hypothetical protein [Sphaerisporangium perillae]|uniref:hypothetical protein n=1 Tax=Sphaerisporangium perillae TaxID=2935860 RepID=UPI00200DAC31|nr:hypothetical protein [Sphaerisporangium perillae]